MKIDIFRGVLYYSYEPEKGRSLVMALTPDYVRMVKSMNIKGEKPDDIVAVEETADAAKPAEHEYADVTGEIVLPESKRKKKKKFHKRPFDKNQPRK